MTIRKEVCLVFQDFQETGREQDKEEGSGICMGIRAPDTETPDLKN